MPQGYDQLSVTRVNGIAEVINEQLAIPASLKYLNLIPVIDDVDEGEVMGYHEQRIVSAEIIPDDQAARVHQGGRIYLKPTRSRT
jgi:hypothetical protein